MGQSPNPDWLNPWQGFSRNMMNAWQDLARQAGVAAPPPPSAPSSLWPDGFEQWARLFASGGGAQSETIERIIDSAKGYAAFMQSALAAAANQGTAAPAWGEAFRSGGFGPGFGIPGAGTMPFGDDLLRAMREMPNQGAGYAALLKALGSLRAPAAADVGELKSWLSLPAFGLMREHQEHYQRMAVAWVEYQEQMARYNALMLKASQRGFELFEGKLSEREQPGRQIDSLRALYDLWVDAAEEGYAEVALSNEFREVCGALVNAQMRVRSQIQQEVERVAVDLGMPTRTELNSIGERLQALRRELRAQGGGDLAREVARLRDEVAALKTVASKRSETAKPVAEKPVAEKTESPAKPVAQARTARKRAKPRTAREAEPKKAAKRAVAAVAPGNFSSRIAQFADASLGRGKKSAKAAKSKKKR
jgi:hypothetical protein